MFCRAIMVWGREGGTEGGREGEGERGREGGREGEKEGEEAGYIEEEIERNRCSKLMFATMFVCGACLIGCVQSREGGRIAGKTLRNQGGLPSFVFIPPSVFNSPPLLSPCFT